jgi:hypothetical protein
MEHFGDETGEKSKEQPLHKKRPIALENEEQRAFLFVLSKKSLHMMHLCGKIALKNIYRMRSNGSSLMKAGRLLV